MKIIHYAIIAIHLWEQEQGVIMIDDKVGGTLSRY